MTIELRKAIAASLLMIAAAFMAWWLVPTNRLVDELGKMQLESVIPKSFGDWVMDPRVQAAVVNPQQAETLSKLYSQTLSRTYINRNTGQAVMLSIAYGEDQREGLEMHYPDLCYPAQGFQIKNSSVGELALAEGTIPVRRLETVMANVRFEPVTYWTVIGKSSTLGGINKKLIEMRYSLRGYVPDGLLFRVSSINKNTEEAFSLQDSFVADLVPEISKAERARFTGFN